MKQHLKTQWIGLIIVLNLVSTAYASPLKTDYKSANIPFAAGTPTTSGLHDITDPYTIAGVNWVANLVPKDPTYIRGTAGNFFDILSAAFPGDKGWKYQSSAKELSDNSLVVHTYDVLGSPTKVGAEFHVEYVPHGTDPTTNIHWIQVVTDNHNLTNNPGHGNNENVVDNPFSPGKRSPYYDDGGAATATQFYDFPNRDDANMSHNWDAVLFLVSGPAANAGPGTITFYGGIGWGWENHPLPVPEPSAAMLMGIGLVGLIAYRRRFV